MLVVVAAMLLGGVLTAVAMRTYRAHARSADASAWILVANANTLLRADLDHLSGDDRNDGLRGLRSDLAAAARRRPPAERALLERYDALIGVAIAFGEKVHDRDGNVDMCAVASRRAQVNAALAVGERIEAALGGFAELARDAERGEAPPLGAPPRRRRSRDRAVLAAS